MEASLNYSLHEQDILAGWRALDLPNALRSQSISCKIISRTADTLTCLMARADRAYYLKLFSNQDLHAQHLGLSEVFRKNGFEFAPKIEHSFHRFRDEAICGIVYESLGTITWERVLMDMRESDQLGPVAKQIGAALGKLHSVDSGTYGMIRRRLTVSEFLRATLKDLRTTIRSGPSSSLLALEHAKKATNLDFADALDSLHDRLANWVGGYRDPADGEGTALVHGDLCSWNLVCGLTQGEVRFMGFIDFDNVSVGAPIMDVVRFFTRGITVGPYQSLLELNPKDLLWQSFIEGYVTIRPFSLCSQEVLALLLAYYLARTITWYWRFLGRQGLSSNDIQIACERLERQISCLRDFVGRPDIIALEIHARMARFDTSGFN